MDWNNTIFVVSCGGHGTRFRNDDAEPVPKVLFPLDAAGRTALEYHFRMLPPAARIALTAGPHRQQIRDYLESRAYFGHCAESVTWIPERYQDMAGLAGRDGIPRSPLGAAAWLLEPSSVRSLSASGVEIVVQTAGNKVGWSPFLLDRLTGRLEAGPAEWLAGVYSAADSIFEDPARYSQFDFVSDGTVHLKGHAPPAGRALAYWYVFKVSAVCRLWEKETRHQIEVRAAAYRQKRRWRLADGRSIDLEIMDINFALLLQHVRFDAVEIGGCVEDWGIELRTPGDVAKCRALFERREQEGALPPAGRPRSSWCWRHPLETPAEQNSLSE